MKFALKTLALSGAILLASAAQAAPNCSRAVADPNGDGIGSENGQSCVVVPTCASAASDPNNTGWGKENGKACLVVKNTTFDITRAMAVGWNLGNALDATCVPETCWGNPKATQAMIDAVKKAGFKTLRVPVSWDDHTSGSDFTIDPAWLARVEEVVNYGLKDGMYVIINVHHNNGWEAPSAANEANAKNRLSKLWTQIANRFNKYDNKLIFEVMNEPRVGDDWWGKQEYFDVVNRLNVAALGSIRKTAGNNRGRMVMLPDYVAGSNDFQLSALSIPADPMVAVSVHAYLPYKFAMSPSDGVSTFSDTSDIDGLMARLKAKFLNNPSRKLAVVIGEFASTNKNNLAEREKHAKYFAKAAKSVGAPFVWWDNNAFATNSGDNMGLLDRASVSWKFKSIVDALMAGYQ